MGDSRQEALQKGQDVTETKKSGAMPVLLGSGFAGVLIAAAFIYLPTPQIDDGGAQTDATTDVAVIEAAPAEEVVAVPLEMPAPAEEVAEEDTTEPAPEDIAEPAPEVAAEPPAPPLPQGPTFDTFRVELDGTMVIAGRAAPGQDVAVILGGVEVDRVTADTGGSFVALPIAGPSEQPRRLTLVGDPDGAAIESLTSYIVAPIAAPVVVAEAEPEPAPEPEPEVVAEAVTDETPSDEAPAAEAETLAAADTETGATDPATPPALEETVVAQETQAPEIETASAAPPTVLQADTDGVRIVQGEQAQEADNVALDAITYDPEGEVQLSGRATSDTGEVQVYINNEPLAVAPITEGDWRLDLPDIDTGVYTLRVDEVDTEGTVVSRIETPFKREEPEEVAAVLAEETAQEGFEVAVRTVQPGSTLWAIAEDTLGDGILYVEVFEANRDLIRDPDLIYPGQIFRIPGISE